MNIRPGLCIGVLALFFLMPGAQAVPVSYDFSGQINAILETNNYTTGLVSTSSTFTGRMTYDTGNYSFSVPGSVPSNYHYIDFGENFSMSLVIDGSLVFDPSPGAAITVVNDDTAGMNFGGDAFYFESTNVRGNDPGVLPVTWGLPLSDRSWWLQFGFRSLSSGTWDTFDLPGQLPVAEFVSQTIRISAGDLSYFGGLIGDGYQITGEITDIRLVSLPEPSTLGLVVLGLGMFGWFRSR